MAFPDRFKDHVLVTGNNQQGVIALALWTALKMAAEEGWDDRGDPYYEEIQEPSITDRNRDPKIAIALGALAPQGYYFGINDDGDYAFISAEGFGGDDVAV